MILVHRQNGTFTTTLITRLGESARRLLSDPRHFQIGALGLLLAYGHVGLGWDLHLDCLLLAFVTCQVTQYACSRWYAKVPFEPRSALITSCSLCLLLRADTLVAIVLAAAFSMASKFFIRVRGKHLFNPANGAIVLFAGLSRHVLPALGIDPPFQAWISPGQWGTATILAFLFACLGWTVVSKAARLDIALTYLGTLAALMIGRAIYLGDPLSIPLHRLESGAVLLFTFFMITDPKTTPDRKAGRILFAMLVALVGWYIQARMFIPEGILYALFLLAPLVPVIDWALPANRYQWERPRAPETMQMQGV